MAKIRKIKEKELIGGTSNTEVYPITHTRAVYDKNNTPLSDTLEFLNTEIIWDNAGTLSNMNDFVVAGVYDIKGERTRIDDNLPILNIGGGHSFNARLTVLDSSISGSGRDDDKCITQVLSFSNRLGQGEVYIRTGKGSSLDSLAWEKWSTLQRNVNVGEVGSLDDLKDNGIYSGVWLFGSLNNCPLTFVCVVINDYFIGTAPRRVSQFVYGLSKFDGSVVYQSRVWDDSKDKWGDWEILNQKEIASMIKSSVDNAIKGVIADAPEAFDTLKEIADWIANDETGAVALANAISANTKAINTEVTRAKEAEKTIDDKLNDEIKRSVAADQDLLRNIDEEVRRAAEAEQDIKDKAIEADSLNFLTRANVVALDYKTIEGVGDEITIPAATTESAGVMSAEDKVSLDSIPNEIEKIKDGDTIVAQAREIHSRNGKTVPDSFLVRTTAGSGTIGDGVASLKSVGGNIVKNLAGDYRSAYNNVVETDDNGIKTILPDNNGWIFIYYGGVESVTTIKDHIYYNACVVQSDEPDNLCFGTANGGFGYIAVQSTVSKTTAWQRLSYIRKSSALDYIHHQTLGIKGTATYPLYAKDFLVIDLTEMFGAGNEPDQATCDKLFGTMDALPQGLNIAKPTEFKSTGFNQFNPDNVLEGKAITNNAIVSGDKKIAVIPCLPCKVGVGENNGYCIHGDFGEDIKVYLTPLNPMEVDGELYMHELTKDATTDTYVPLIKGYMLVEVPTTANLCAHFLWSEDKCERDSYEPYFESKIELPDIPQMSEWGLAGIQSNGTLVCDEIDFERGVYVKEIHAEDLSKSGFWINKTDNFSYFIVPATVTVYDNNIMCERYSSIRGTPNVLLDKSIMLFQKKYICIRDDAYTTIEDFRASLDGVYAYYAMATPEEYPLPKVDNNYISSDYGVEQFDSNIPCNANNLYYMRSLAGETRNFLDRMYDNTAKTDAKEVADYITNGIEGNKELATNAPNLALRALFVEAGMEYNDSGKDITKTTPWGEQVIHMVNRYYLNGLGDITEAQALRIYMIPTNRIYAGAILDTYLVNNMRTSLVAKSEVNISIADKAVNMNNVATNNAYIEIIKFSDRSVIYTNALHHGFYQCGKLKRILDTINVSNVSSFSNTFKACSKLIEVKLSGLRANISFSDSVNLSKNSLLHMITNATPTTAITITLHADAYARLANDVDIVAALAAQPLITLVSA